MGSVAPTCPVISSRLTVFGCGAIHFILSIFNIPTWHCSWYSRYGKEHLFAPSQLSAGSQATKSKTKSFDASLEKRCDTWDPTFDHRFEVLPPFIFHITPVHCSFQPPESLFTLRIQIRIKLPLIACPRCTWGKAERASWTFYA